MNGQVHLDLLGDQGGAVKQVQVSFVADDGTVYSAGDPISVQPGNTVTYGPASVHVTVESGSNYGPTPTGGGQGQPAPQPSPQAAHGQPAKPPARR